MNRMTQTDLTFPAWARLRSCCLWTGIQYSQQKVVNTKEANSKIFTENTLLHINYCDLSSTTTLK